MAVTEECNENGKPMRVLDRVGLRIDATRAPVRTFTPDGRLKHVDYTAVMGFGDVVQDYGDRKEFRPAEEVTDPAAMASFVGLPFVDEHPDDGVDADNATEVTRGVVLKTWAEHPDMWGTVRVYDGRTIARIDSGKRGVSNGYSVLGAEQAPGVFKGTAYQIVQRRIRGDHLALARSPRAQRDGQYTQIHMDSTDALRVQKLEDEMEMVKINLPGIGEVEVPKAVADLLNAQKAQIEELQKGKPTDGNAPGAPPGEPLKDSATPAPTPRADSMGVDHAAVERLITKHLEAERPRARAEARQDSLAYSRFRTEAESTLRLDAKTVEFTGDLARDQVAVAKALLGDDSDVKETEAKLASRADSDVATAHAAAPGLYKAAIRIARERHNKTGEQLGHLVPRTDSAPADDILEVATRGFRPTTA